MDFTKNKIAFIAIIGLISACGPHPSLSIQGPKTPERVWEIFQSRYQEVNSLALQGSFIIKGPETHEISLQVYYIPPDSFAFLAEGTLGTDIARGAIVNGSGFWEIPHDKYYEAIRDGDEIAIDNYGTTINLSDLIRSIFFFKDLAAYEFVAASGTRFIYEKSNDGLIKKLDINKDSATPMGQTIQGPNGIFQTDYYDWKVMDDSLILPGIIKIDFHRSGIKGEYRISKLKSNALIPSKYFTPLYNF